MLEWDKETEKKRNRDRESEQCNGLFGPRIAQAADRLKIDRDGWIGGRGAGTAIGNTHSTLLQSAGKVTLPQSPTRIPLCTARNQD